MNLGCNYLDLSCIGENFITHVDVLLVDVEEIDDLAWNR